MKSKLSIFTFVICMSIILSGCIFQQQLNFPTIQETSPLSDITSAKNPYRMKFFIHNPSINTFTGNLTYKYDNNCVSNPKGFQGIISEVIEINPNGKLGIEKEFTPVKANYYDEKAKPECIQKPLKFSVLLHDKSGEFRDSAEFTLTITD